MNDYIDSKAKDFLRECTTGPTPRSHYSVRLLYELWALLVGGEKTSCIDKQEVYRTVYGPTTRIYWKNHHNIPIPSGSTVDWEPSHQAIQKLPTGLRRWRAKFSSGSIGVGNQLFHYKYQDHSNCPLCKEHREKVSYVLHYTDQGVTTHTLQRIEGPVKKTLDENLSGPVLSKAILDILAKWRLGTPILPIYYDTLVCSAV